MTVRESILMAAAKLLAESPSGEISTRDVCEAAGVAPPALYRHFGDKSGLLSAVVDFGFEQYLAAKRGISPSLDPVQDLRDGWDNHVSFAIGHPNYYKLMYSPVLTSRPEAAAEAHRLLTEVVERVAVQGRLSVPIETAAQMIMSANAGVALALLYRPELNTDPLLSSRLRDAVIGSVTGSNSPATDQVSIGPVATNLRALLATDNSAPFTPTESALLHDWLARLEQ
jgi:AcrR family transcriptional regulator